MCALLLRRSSQANWNKIKCVNFINPVVFILTMEGSLVNKIDLQSLYISETYCHKTSTRPPSCTNLDHRLCILFPYGFYGCPLINKLVLQSRAFQTAQLIVGHNASLKPKFTDDPGQAIQQNSYLRERHFGVLVIGPFYCFVLHTTYLLLILKCFLWYAHNRFERSQVFITLPSDSVLNK